MRKGLPEILLIICSIIWGFGYVATTIALNEGITPLQQMSVRFAVATVLLSIIFKKELQHISRKSINAGIVIGIFLFIGYFLQTVGQKYTTPAKTGFITSTSVIMVPFVHWFLSKKRPDKFSVLGALMCIVGVSMLTLNGSLDSINLGDILVLGCAVSFTFQFMSTDYAVKNYNPVCITIIQLAFCSIICLILTYFENAPIVITKKGSFAILYMTIFSTTIAFVFQSIAQRYTDPNKASIILSTESVFGALWSMLLIKEVITFKMFIGGLLMFLAIIVVEAKPSLKSLFKKYAKSEDCTCDACDIMNEEVVLEVD